MTSAVAVGLDCSPESRVGAQTRPPGEIVVGVELHRPCEPLLGFAFGGRPGATARCASCTVGATTHT